MFARPSPLDVTTLPLSMWTHERTLPTLKACESYRGAITLMRCIASDDPRLKGKIARPHSADALDIIFRGASQFPSSPRGECSRDETVEPCIHAAQPYFAVARRCPSGSTPLSAQAGLRTYWRCERSR